MPTRREVIKKGAIVGSAVAVGAIGAVKQKGKAKETKKK